MQDTMCLFLFPLKEMKKEARVFSGTGAPTGTIQSCTLFKTNVIKMCFVWFK